VNSGHGQIKAQLAAENENQITAELVSLINSNVAPPEPVTENDVYIRAMHIVSDQINSFGGRFPAEEHDNLAELLIDSPVLVGHRKDRLPIGRTFHAVTVERENQRWVKSYFYWLRSADNAQDLRDNIDAGIYKECSIGFTFLLPQCSICGQDIRTCDHQPLAEYPVDGIARVCHFDYRQIEKVLETSLVYRGATPDTSISKELQVTEAECDGSGSAKELTDFEEIYPHARYIVTPFYEGISVTARRVSGRLALERSDCSSVSLDKLRDLDKSGLADFPDTRGRLVGYRGKERCSAAELEKYLSGETGPVNRVVLHLMPSAQLEKIAPHDSGSRFAVRGIRHRIVNAMQLAQTARELMTREGVEILRLDESGSFSRPLRISRAQIEQALTNRYHLTTHAPGGHAVLHICADSLRHAFEIKQFDCAGLLRGSRFVADMMTQDESSIDGSSTSLMSGRITEAIQAHGGVKMTLMGGLEGAFILRPIILQGRRRFLFYRPVAQ
jgi:hypothetical protein